MASNILAAVRQIKSNVAEHLQAAAIERLCHEVKHVWRQRLLGPVATVHAFLLQVLHGEEKGSGFIMDCVGAEWYARRPCTTRARSGVVATGWPMSPPRPMRNSLRCGAACSGESPTAATLGNSERSPHWALRAPFELAAGRENVTNRPDPFSLLAEGLLHYLRALGPEIDW
jgi:hypothetical protein